MKSISFQGIPLPHRTRLVGAAAATMSLASTTVIAAAFQGAALTEQSHLIASIGKSVLRLKAMTFVAANALFPPVCIAPHTGSAKPRAASTSGSLTPPKDDRAS